MVIIYKFGDLDWTIYCQRKIDKFIGESFSFPTKNLLIIFYKKIFGCPNWTPDELHNSISCIWL
ncbi:hypothetical protein OMAG_001246 [Candidatus Omnitrophus magneticus]|uniref:Uncharacterized protein n=1 Tax=Candidatus Omnitrophus magneticus TaxID=1609969 RepID=A0A0F0CTX0_9BACT|nr:hypothetical protein OMAG_001246 [Candidatus Omnitrophus magneticus]